MRFRREVNDRFESTIAKNSLNFPAITNVATNKGIALVLLHIAQGLEVAGIGQFVQI